MNINLLSLFSRIKRLPPRD